MESWFLTLITLFTYYNGDIAVDIVMVIISILSLWIKLVNIINNGYNGNFEYEDLEDICKS